MAEFSTSVTLTVEVDPASLRAAKQEVEEELEGAATVGVGSLGGASPATDGGVGAPNLVELQNETVDLLDDILDEIETGGVGGTGSGPGGPGGLLPFGGGGGGGGGPGFIEGLLASDVLRRFTGGGGGRLGGLLSALGGVSAAGTAVASGQFGRGGLRGEANTGEFGGPLGQFRAAAAGAQDIGQFIAAGFDPEANTGLGPGPGGRAGQPAIDGVEVLQTFQEQTPVWLDRLDSIVTQLDQPTGGGIDRTEGGDLRLSRLAGNPSGATGIDRTEGGDRRLARAAANQRAEDRADRGPDATRGRPDIDVSVEAEGVDRREVEQAMERAKREAVREIEQQFRQSQRPGGG